jgi:hypothetical protein
VIGHGRMLQTLGDGVYGMEKLELVVSGSVGEIGSGEDGVGRSDSVVAWSVVGLCGCVLLEV